MVYIFFKTPLQVFIFQYCGFTLRGETCDSLRPALLRAGGEEIVGDDDDIVGLRARRRGGGRPLDDGHQVLGLLDQGGQQGNLHNRIDKVGWGIFCSPSQEYKSEVRNIK